MSVDAMGFFMDLVFEEISQIAPRYYINGTYTVQPRSFPQKHCLAYFKPMSHNLLTHSKATSESSLRVV